MSTKAGPAVNHGPHLGNNELFQGLSDNETTIFEHLETSPPEHIPGQENLAQPGLIEQQDPLLTRDIDPTLLTVHPALVDWSPDTEFVENASDVNSVQQNSVLSREISAQLLPETTGPVTIPSLSQGPIPFFQSTEDENFWDSILTTNPGENHVDDPFCVIEDQSLYLGIHKGPQEADDISSNASTLVVPGAHDNVFETSEPVLLQSSKAFSTDDDRWQGTLNRSRAADRSFLYGVTTTGVFCRPSCPARRAGRDHVEFFSFPTAIEDAKSAGYRACKRCVPDTTATIDKGVNGVAKVLRLIVEDAFEPRMDRGKSLKLEDLAREADLSPFHFQRVFKANTRMTPGDFATACQSLALQDALAKSGWEAEQGLTTSKFPPLPDLNTFVRERLKMYSRWNTRTAKKALGGVPPMDYASGLPEMHLLIARAESPAGQVLVACSGTNAIHAVAVGADGQPSLQSRFLSTRESKDCDHVLQQQIQLMQEEAADRDPDLPGDMLQTLWRARIWLHLVRKGNLPVD